MENIKNQISNKKSKIKKVAYGIGLLTIGCYLGIKLEETVIGIGLEKMARSGKIIKTVIDNEVYIMSIVKEQIIKE